MKQKLKSSYLNLKRAINKAYKIIFIRHKLIIPPRLLKRYINSFFKNVFNNSNISYYDPMIRSEYNEWLKKEGKKKIQLKEFKYNPLISIAIPVYNVPEEYLRNCLDSIIKQKYTNFEVCLADDCSTKEHVKKVLEEYKKKDSRIKVVYREKNGHISEATNSALSICKGEFVGLVDNDDILNEYALYEVVQALNENKNLDMIYTDEDKMDIEGNRSGPHFKPDYSPDTLLSHNYICHFTVLRKSIIDKIGGFRKGYEGAQDYDLFLRFTEETTPDKIHHISKILYHWRMIPGSTATDISNKNYAVIAGKKSLEDALKRRKILGDVNVTSNNYYTIDYKYSKEPSISIIIPTKNHYDDLKKCVDSILEKTNYKNYEIIIVDNNSDEEKTLNLLKAYENDNKNVKIIKADCEFNFSKINNIAVQKSSGEYILLLNNDTEIISSDWLHIMVGYAMQEHIGAVGAKLYYKNKTVQHAGVILDGDNIATHISSGEYYDNPGINGRLVVPYNYNAVTAACLMVKKDKYLLVHGLDEKLKVAYNDVDFCLKLREKGFYNICVPQVELFHYESKSRGLDNTTEKYKRFVSEIDYMKKRWNKKLKNDEYYNINYSMKKWFMIERGNDNV